jgi:hypothetical protein
MRLHYRQTRRRAHAASSLNLQRRSFFAVLISRGADFETPNQVKLW